MNGCVFWVNDCMKKWWIFRGFLYFSMGCVVVGLQICVCLGNVSSYLGGDFKNCGNICKFVLLVGLCDWCLCIMGVVMIVVGVFFVMVCNEIDLNVLFVRVGVQLVCVIFVGLCMIG